MFLEEDAARAEKTSSPQPVRNKFYRQSKMLSRERDFKRLLFSGKKQPTQNFIFFWEKGEGRLGIIASRKVGKAVARNRIRRVTKEAYRHKQSCFEKINMVIVAKKNATGINLKSCQKDFENFSSGISL